MPLSVDFTGAELSGMFLAQLGNPLRGEGLRTSKNLCRYAAGESELLTHCLLKPFRSLDPHHLTHPSRLESNTVYRSAARIFDDGAALLEEGAEMARHLYASSHHASIKPGDLCIAVFRKVVADGTTTDAISIVKSESKVPFLQVTADGEDLQLTTQQGIYPDKIDKGCLVINHSRSEGFLLYLFDRSGNTHFWNREFLNAVPVQNEDFLTRRYSEMCLAFARSGLPEDGMKEERVDLARRAVSYLAEADTFDMDDFERVAEASPAVSHDFRAFKEAYEEEAVGRPLEENFVVSKKEARRAERKLNGRLSLDVGVDLRFSTGFQKSADQFLERGFDEEKQMKYLKIYYHAEG